MNRIGSLDEPARCQMLEQALGEWPRAHLVDREPSGVSRIVGGPHRATDRDRDVIVDFEDPSPAVGDVDHPCLGTDLDVESGLLRDLAEETAATSVSASSRGP